MFAAALALLPVLGSIEKTRETFEGSLSGDRLLVTSERTSCSGQLDRKMGHGFLLCGDGRSGTITFDVIGRHGTAYGRLGGENIVLTFG